MSFKLFHVILAFVFMVLSCGDSKKVTDASHKDQESLNSGALQTVDFEIIFQDAHGGIEQKEERVVKNEEDLQKIYDHINQFREPAFKMPEIDFEKDMVIALFMGEKTSGGFSIEIAAIEMSEENLIIHIKENSPGPTDMVTNVMCQPICMVKVPQTNKKVIFKQL